MGLTREKVNAQLLSLGDRVVAVVDAARQSALESTTCDSWLLGDDDACAAILKQVEDLKRRAEKLRESARALAGATTITRKQVDDFHALGQLFIESAEYMGQVGNTGDLSDLLRATVHDLGGFVADTVGTGVTAFLGGLGPVGIVVLGVAIYAAVRMRFG